MMAGGKGKKMVKLVYCKAENPLGEIAEVEFLSLADALGFIKDNKSGLLEHSAGYSVYSVVPGGEIPETLYNFTR